MNPPYLLFPIGVLAFLLYLLSHFLVRNSFISKIVHRKIWNTILLIAFLVTAILGLILTIQINYKFEIPYIKQILTLHVDFGIAMSMVGTFHLLWHWSYYTKLLKGEKIKEVIDSDQQSITEAPIDRHLFLAVALLGFGSIVTQVILLREMLNLFSGNELITGIILASWMTLTGLGAWAGRSTMSHKSRMKTVIQSIVWLGLLPIFLLVMLYFVKHYLFPPGILIDIRYIYPITLLLLAPYCLLSGHLFAVFTSPHPSPLSPQERGGRKVDPLNHLIPCPSTERRRAFFSPLLLGEGMGVRADRLYAIETAGSVVGGLVVSFVLIFWFSSIRSLLVILLMHLLVAFILDKRKKKIWIYFGGALASIVLFILPSEVWLKKLVFPNQEILQTRETPYGNVTITQSANQINVFENHELLYTTQNTIENEETVHYPMLQHPAPKNVLLVQGGTRSLIKEILKYKTLRHLDYVEENLWLMQLVANYDTLPSDPRLSITNIDARKFLNTKPEPKYDIVILAVPEPSTLQTNRYYTLEFFQLLKTRINENAIVSLSLSSAGNYFSAKNIQIHSLIVKTLKQVFPKVLIIPGEKDYVIASTQPLSAQMASLSEAIGLETSYVNQYYIDDFSLSERVKLLEQSLVSGKEINRDFRPTAVYYSTSHYASKFSGKTLLITLLPLLLLLLPTLWLKSGSLALYISGFSISALEVLLLLSFQIVFGFVYAASGVIISVCMAGLATGAIVGWHWNFQPNKRTIVLNQLTLGILAALFIWVISKANITWNNSILYLVFSLATLLPSICAGLQFSQMIKRNEISMKTKSSRLYGAELFGAALGAALVSTVLLPVLGVQSVIFTIVASNLIITIFLLISKK